MKRFLLVIMLVGATLAATTLTVRAAATTTVQEYTIPIGGGGPTPGCTEVVNIQGGSLHAVITVVTDDTGGFHVSGTFNYQDVRGVGLTTGTTYAPRGKKGIAARRKRPARIPPTAASAAASGTS
jgi:hypothetical protein